MCLLTMFLYQSGLASASTFRFNGDSTVDLFDLDYSSSQFTWTKNGDLRIRYYEGVNNPIFEFSTLTGK